MGDQWVDFKAVKAAVSMEMVLEKYGVKLRRVNETYLRGKCPLPSHTSDKSKESFGVDTAKNVWACQSASCVKKRGGRKGGNVLDFVAAAENSSIREAALKLQGWLIVNGSGGQSAKAESAATEQKESRRVEGKASGVEGNPPLKFTLQGIDTTHPYLAARGILKETAELFGVGFFPGRGSMKGRVVIPIHNEAGELVGYAGRSIDGSEPRYKLPNGFRKLDALFNLHRVTGEYVVVVEGFFDCMKVSQAGFPCVALMGLCLSEHQQKLLAGKRVVLLMDGDEAGREATKEMVPKLVQTNFVRVVPQEGQPDEKGKEELQALLAPVI